MILSEAEAGKLAGGNNRFNARLAGEVALAQFAQPFADQQARQLAALDAEMVRRAAPHQQALEQLNVEYARRRQQIEQGGGIVVEVSPPAKGPGSQGRPY